MRQFDASLAAPLFTLPSTALPDTNPLNLLSPRNLLRGKKMGLPSGQQVARLMGVTPLTNDQLSQNHRIEVEAPIVITGPTATWWRSSVSSTWRTRTQEALRRSGMGRRGPAVVLHLEGGRDRRAARATWRPAGPRRRPHRGRGPRRPAAKGPQLVSVLEAAWKPTPPIAPARGQFTMADLLKYAGVWS